MISISSNFDSGAILVDRCEQPDDISLRIRADSHADFTQWFHFRVAGVRDTPITVRLTNAGQSTYPGGWRDYSVVASYDHSNWFRVATRLVDGVLEWQHTPAADAIYYAYFEPYSWERHLELIGRIGAAPGVEQQRLGATVDGRDLDILYLGSRQAQAPRVWIIARQHPGETMAEWFVEGLLERLLDGADPVSRTLLGSARFCVVPNMNPDGAVRGNLRTNAAGANLNREWLEPSRERSPEVWLVRAAMQKEGVALFVDAHGDEALPYVFVAGNDMVPGFTQALADSQASFIANFKNASPDFQDRFGYPRDKHSTEALKLASKWVGHEFGCLSLTLEMPFKDNANLPDSQRGWDGARSKRLGAAILLPIAQYLADRAQM